jgi:hypothetical protein
MEWTGDSELLVADKVYDVSNPKWIKNLIRILENDHDTPQDQEASEAP